GGRGEQLRALLQEPAVVAARGERCDAGECPEPDCAGARQARAEKAPYGARTDHACLQVASPRSARAGAQPMCRPPLSEKSAPVANVDLSLTTQAAIGAIS